MISLLISGGLALIQGLPWIICMIWEPGPGRSAPGVEGDGRRPRPGAGGDPALPGAGAEDGDAARPRPQGTTRTTPGETKAQAVPRMG